MDTSRSRPSGRLTRLAGRALGAFIVVMIGGNLIIVGLWQSARAISPPRAVPATVRGVSNLTMVDERVWRGAAPNLAGYESLVKAGITTVIDLRAEPDVDDLDPHLEALGLRVVHLPIRDGQTPSEPQVASFLAVVNAAPGTAFVHCGAGVGRSGSMAAAYLVRTGQDSGVRAVARNLTVGPPSLEQLAFAAGLERDEIRRPPLPVVALSRFLDAPRRLWSIVS
ncbi:MAG: protein-tyrosine phosphatase family protein [Acidimicrobiales bacterium]